MGAYQGTESSTTLPGGRRRHFWQFWLSHWAQTDNWGTLGKLRALVPFGLPFTIIHAFCNCISMTLAHARADSTSSQAAAFRQVPACPMPGKASGFHQS